MTHKTHKGRSSPAVSVTDERQAPSAASVVADNADDDNDWELEGVVSLVELKRVGVRPHLCSFQDSCRTKQRKVPGTVAETFELATKLVNQEALGEADPSAELVSVKAAVAAASLATKETKKQLASLRQKHDALKGSLLARFVNAQAVWKVEKEAFHGQAQIAVNYLY